MSEAVDSEVLIALVEARPILWDKTQEHYKDRTLTKNAWNEVCYELNEKFYEMGDQEKSLFGKEVIRKWSNLRDSFAKSLRKLKESKSNGPAAKKPRLYIFSEELKFLRKIYEERDRDMSDTLSEDVHGEEVGVSQENPPVSTFRFFKKPKTNGRSENHDSNMSFFHSLLPHLQNYSHEEILQFQMGVLQVIWSINERKRRHVLPSQFSQISDSNQPHRAAPSFPEQLPTSLIPQSTKDLQHQFPQFFQPSAEHLQSSQVKMDDSIIVKTDEDIYVVRTPSPESTASSALSVDYAL